MESGLVIIWKKQNLVTRFHPNDGDDTLPHLDPIDFHRLVGKIPLTTPKEVTDEMKKLNLKNAPGFGLITGEILNRFQKRPR